MYTMKATMVQYTVGIQEGTLRLKICQIEKYKQFD